MSRSGRTIKPPIWMKNYEVSNASYTLSINKFIFYDGLSSSYKAYLSSISQFVESDSFLEVLKDKAWVQAMQKEIEVLE